MEKRKASSSSLEVLQTKKHRKLQEAKDLISHLHYEEEIQALKRRWLMRRWPEYREDFRCNSKSPSNSGFLMDRYIPESLLRNDNSVVAMKSDIQRSLDVFKKESERDNQSQQFKLEHSDMQLEKIQGLPDKELFGALPLFFKQLKLSALRTLANVVTGKKYHSNRNFTIKKIKRGLSMLFSQTGEKASECLQKVQDILRNPYNIRLSYVAALTEMPSSWPDAAKSTLNQLEKFPIHTLYVMKIMLKRRLVGSKEAGVNKSSMAKRVKQLGEKFIWNAQECDPIPEPLKKALLVASLSARQIFGEDGGLLQILGPISPETNDLYNDFLKAISHVHKLQHIELKDVYSCLYSDRCFPSIRHRVLQRKIRMLLIDSLLESCDRTIPEPVMRCMIMINRLGAEEEVKRKGNPNSHKTELRVEAESECVLNVSSHLQQIICDWTKQAGLDQGWTELHLDESEETCEEWFTENSYNSFALAGDGEAYVGESSWDPELAKDQDSSLKEHEMETSEGQELKYSSEEDMLRKNSCLREEKGIDILQQIQGISDEAGLFAYHLLGCMMDEFLIRQGDVLEAPARAYLRIGLPATIMDTGEREPFNYQENMDSNLLLNIAEKLFPQMPGSVIENVKLSLGPL